MRVVFTLSKSPHLHMTYVVTVCRVLSTAVTANLISVSLWRSIWQYALKQLSSILLRYCTFTCRLHLGVPFIAVLSRFVSFGLMSVLDVSLVALLPIFDVDASFVCDCVPWILACKCDPDHNVEGRLYNDDQVLW